MKKAVFVLVLALVFAHAFYPLEGKAQMGPGMMHRGYGMGPGMMGGGGYGGWYCPYCGRYMGPGQGYGMGLNLSSLRTLWVRKMPRQF